MKPWLRPLPFALLASSALAAVGRDPIDDAADGRSAALVGALAARGITCEADDVTWVDPPRGVGSALVGEARAVVRGRIEGAADKQGGPAAPPEDEAPAENADIFLVRARLSPEGHLLDVRDVHELTRSSGADEGRVVLSGERAAYVVSVAGRPEAVHVIDLDGHDDRAYEELSRLQRWQVALAELQATGQRRGVRRTVYALTPPPASATIAFEPSGELVITTQGDDGAAGRVVVDPTRDAATSGEDNVRVTPEIVAKPPTFGPWMSDRLRAARWFGDEKNQALKAVVFTALEHVKNVKSRLTGDTGQDEATEDLASLNQDDAPLVAATFNDPELGWPPQPLEPYIKPPLRGEGQWVTLDKDAFITPIPGHAAPFVTTFVRGDPSALSTRVYVTAWDPRLVALHMEAGTVEPVNAAGEAGPGQIPRAPEVMRHVVAGFNGGFQATHGEFGMQVSGSLYLPPKPYGATVMEMRDGSTAFGAWPRSAEVPSEVLSFRQNMTALVQADRYNPWGRGWWGGVPPGWHDAIHTTRSGLCLTKEGFVAYFWGNDIGPEPLGRAMLAARCAFGIHLDMNPGLAGFEFYNMSPEDEFEPLGRPLQRDWEQEGVVKDMPSFRFRSRRMIKSMGHILFPRYIQRDARDFFYLTTRPVLPGAPIGPGQAPGEDGAWRVKGLPQHGFPYALAATTTAAGRAHDGARVHVVRVDPRMVQPKGTAGDGASAGTSASEETVFVVGRVRDRAGRREVDPAERTRPDGQSLWLGAHVFTVGRTGHAGAAHVVDLAAPGSVARAAVGVADEDGTLHWVETDASVAPTPETGAQMLALLARLGCSGRGLVAGGRRALLGGALDVTGAPAALRTDDGEGKGTEGKGTEGAATLVRSRGPAAQALFASNEIVPASVWQPLQRQRVTWRPTRAPPEKPAAPAGSGSSATPTTLPGAPKPTGGAAPPP